MLSKNKKIYNVNTIQIYDFTILPSNVFNYVCCTLYYISRKKRKEYIFFLIFLFYQTNCRILEENILVWDCTFILQILSFTSYEIYPLQSFQSPLQNSSSTKYFWTLIGSSLSPYLNKSVQSLISAERTRGRKPFCNIRL